MEMPKENYLHQFGLVSCIVKVLYWDIVFFFFFSNFSQLPGLDQHQGLREVPSFVGSAPADFSGSPAKRVQFEVGEYRVQIFLAYIVILMI